jgi:hypothetical protein
MPDKRQYHFNIGDRVAERPKSHGLFAVRDGALEIAKRNRSQRYGTVVGYTTQVNKRGSRTKFLIIQWDHLKSPMTHARHRICPIDQLATLTNNVIVPGE